MATKKKIKSGGRVKVNKLKVKREKVEELSKDAQKKIQGGVSLDGGTGDDSVKVRGTASDIRNRSGN